MPHIENEWANAQKNMAVFSKRLILLYFSCFKSMVKADEAFLSYLCGDTGLTECCLHL